jgi:hypothetical protein
MLLCCVQDVRHGRRWLIYFVNKYHSSVGFIKKKNYQKTIGIKPLEVFSSYTSYIKYTLRRNTFNSKLFDPNFCHTILICPFPNSLHSPHSWLSDFISFRLRSCQLDLIKINILPVHIFIHNHKLYILIHPSGTGTRANTIISLLRDIPD